MIRRMLFACGFLAALTGSASALPITVCNEGWETTQVARDVFLNKVPEPHAIARTNEEVYNLTRTENACATLEVAEYEPNGFYAAIELPGDVTALVLKCQIHSIIQVVEIESGMTVVRKMRTPNFHQFAVYLAPTDQLRMLIFGEKPA